MWKNWKFILAACLMATAAPTISGHLAAQDDKVAQLMKRKLTHSQKILEGIAVNDFDLIVRNAEELIIISKTVEWRVLKTPQYEVHSNDFRRIAEQLVTQAKAKNSDGAALAYVDLTLTCVKCHKHVREIRMAKAD